MEKTVEYYQSLDKRSKEYRDWKEKFLAKQEEKPKGLGDVVKSITDATGISKVVEFFTPEGKDCGCEERRLEWNKKYPFNKVNCLEEDEFEYLTEFFKTKHTKVDNKTREELYVIYNRVFNMAQKPTNCGSCVNRVIKSLKTIITSYE